MNKPYRTLFVGTLEQDSFLSAGGSDDPFTSVDSPFCRDGDGRPTLRGSGLAGALIATLRRSNGSVPDSISGSEKGRRPSAWRFFNSHPEEPANPAFRQHVAIHDQTGAAADGALFNVETLPPGTRWPFLLEVDDALDAARGKPNDSQAESAASLARQTLSHWAAGRCLIGRDVARGLGWMTLHDLQEYTLTADHAGHWPNARKAGNYPKYIREELALQAGVTSQPVGAAQSPLHGWLELSGTVSAGERKIRFDNETEDRVYGIDSLSIGGHASEELEAAWYDRFLAPDGMRKDKAKASFDPDFAVVTWKQGEQRVPYIPGSSLRGPLRHSLARLLRAQGGNVGTVDALFGPKDCKRSAKLLICDALPVKPDSMKLAWLQHHAEDEFTGGAFGSSKFDRVAVMAGRFRWRMVLEDATPDESKALKAVLDLARAGQLGIGGSQWRGHGWLRWEIKDWDKLENNHG